MTENKLKIKTGQQIFDSIEGVWNKHCSSCYNATQVEVDAMAKETDELGKEQWVAIEGLVTLLQEWKRESDSYRTDNTKSEGTRNLALGLSCAYEKALKELLGEKK